MKEIELLKIIFKDSPDILEPLNKIDKEIERLNKKLELINKLVEREFPPNEFITMRMKKILKGEKE